MKQNYRVPEPAPVLPTVSIAVRGNKLKMYQDNTVYLKNGTEFELFFENMTADNYKAEIIINGESEHNDLVLRPGQRFRLDRFMDTDKKLLFDVYKVDNNETVKEIIKNNGSVVVKFFKELKYAFTTYTTNTWNGTINPITFGGSFNTGSTRSMSKGITNDVNYNLNVSNTGNINTSNMISNYMAQTLTNASTQTFDTFQCNCAAEPAKIETGRVEEGSQSDQKFQTVNMSFNSWYDNMVTINMKPESQRPAGGSNVVTSDVRSYCKCGRRAKQGNNYCGGCGRKI